MGLFKSIGGVCLGFLLAVLIIYWYSTFGLLAVVATGTGLLFYDIQRKRKTENQSFGVAFKHYLTINFLSWLGLFMKRRMEKATKDVKKAQETTLFTQLKINADTEYGKRYNFSSIKTVEEFISSHPLTRYSQYETYIERMMKGETKVLTSEQPVVFACTSGTSGKSNILPMVKRQGLVFLTDGISLVYNCMSSAFPNYKYLQKSLKFFYNPKWRESEAGIKIGPNSSTPARSEGLLHLYSTPTAGYKVLSEPEALYIHLLFGLKDRRLGMIEANFCSLIFNSLKSLEERWHDMVDDIEQGRINPDLNIEEDVRNELNSNMKPDPKRASELREAYKQGIVGLGKRIWPECNMVIGADTGTFELYGRKLRETYLKDIPLYSPVYAASEGLLGVNIWPLELPSRYLLIPTAHFFEFIPVEKSEELQPKTLLMHEVQVDEDYELVITNLSCVYRYRFGDVVRITGFHNQCPIIEFKYRQGQFLNVRGEKTSEAVFYNALMETASNWPNIRVMDYCCAESVYVENAGIIERIVGSAPCYHVFLEVESTSNTQQAKLTSSDAEKLDATLCSKSYVYLSFRNKRSIGTLKLHLVKPGSFSELRKFMIAHTTASSVQYKVPRVLKRTEAVQFMMDRVV